MEAIKKIATVKNHRLTVQLPTDFNHHRVEVIIMPCDTAASSPKESLQAWQKDFLSITCWDEPDKAESVPSWPLQAF